MIIVYNFYKIDGIHFEKKLLELGLKVDNIEKAYGLFYRADVTILDNNLFVLANLRFGDVFRQPVWSQSATAFYEWLYEISP